MGNVGQQRPDNDPYRELCRAMKPGLLITVNCSHPGKPTGIDEMKVIRVDESGEVHLRENIGSNGEMFVLTHDDAEYGTALKEVSDTEFAPIHDPVYTIEVVGIDA